MVNYISFILAHCIVGLYLSFNKFIGVVLLLATSFPNALFIS